MDGTIENPTFPEFRGLTISDKVLVSKFTRLYPPYSDFNFWSLIGWDIADRAAFSILNDNLVIRMKAYLEDSNVYSLLGINRIDESVDALLEVAGELSMVPEVVVQRLSNRAFVRVHEDKDNHDYVLSTEQLDSLSGRQMKGVRSKVRRFERKHRDHLVRMLDLTNEDDVQAVLGLTRRWSERKGFDASKVQEDVAVTERHITYSPYFNSLSVGVFMDGQLIGFTINEIVHAQTAMGHLGKTDLAFDGITAYLEHITAKMLREIDCLYLNLEQDVGIPNLRQTKLLYRPAAILKKYKVVKANRQLVEG